MEQQEESDGKESMGGQGSHPEADFWRLLEEEERGREGGRWEGKRLEDLERHEDGL